MPLPCHRISLWISWLVSHLASLMLIDLRYDNLEQMDKVAGVQAQVNDVTSIMKVLLLPPLC